MTKRGGGCLTAIALVLSLAVVALGAGLVYLVSTNQPSATPQPSQEGGEVEPASFAEYSWDELSAVAQLIASAESDEKGREVAAEYGISLGDSRQLLLDDGRSVTLTVVGLRADERSDGSGLAGLTLMLSPISLRPMNSSDTNVGGWEASELRSWLAGEGKELLPDDLAASVVSVRKLTNNTGVTNDAAAVTQTDDELWLFSASEVCGAITWFTDEYGDEPNLYTGYVDFAPYDEMLSSEGEQYEYFASSGVRASSDSLGVLKLAYGSSTTSWWYRTSYPYTFTGEDASYFYQVMASGYPSMTSLASEPSGVTVGLCL